MSKLPHRGAISDAQLTVIENGGLLLSDGRILEVGLFRDLQSGADEIKLVEGDTVCLPGFIDAHTHSCFAGSRARDYAMRNSGKSYLEIAKAGGGIWDTVTQTRKASQEELVKNTVSRCQQHLAHGVTTVEIKSGYGLSVEEELKMLQAIKAASKKVELDVVPTCLAAHMVPKDWDDSPEAYLEYISNNLFPILQSENLTNRIDAFIEESAFTPQQIKPYFQKATEMGFDITVHADQFTTGGSEVALAFSAVSADHLEASAQKEIERLGKNGTIATALPGATIGLGCGFTPARTLLDAGACLAIASDYNPGSAPMGDLLTQASILGTFEKLSNAEVLSGITFRGAAALNVKDRGILAEEKQADFVVFKTGDYREITYHQGQLKPSEVWKNGTKVY